MVARSVPRAIITAANALRALTYATPALNPNGQIFKQISLSISFLLSCNTTTLMSTVVVGCREVFHPAAAFPEHHFQWIAEHKPLAAPKDKLQRPSHLQMLAWVHDHLLKQRSAKAGTDELFSPPLYFQHQGHSRSIVGLETKTPIANSSELLKSSNFEIDGCRVVQIILTALLVRIC